ncbi:hypothetical protein EVAR_67168_1 [Eumeta japonica]|uniref:Protein kinase domain-containing protein n=1 Tax=Eumeta variegata TaxID=151549 RepID=A0A4C1ZV61_EUMVA|nr:hypothetical protein EVAR_67168_1 [Eumeta japonica]
MSMVHNRQLHSNCDLTVERCDRPALVMGGFDELRDYQVLGVREGGRSAGIGVGTLYRVRHRRSGHHYLWKPVDCVALHLEPQELRAKLERDARTIRRLRLPEPLRYHNSIVHVPSNTLYLVLEDCAAPSLRDLASTHRLLESLVWRLLLRLAHLCKALESVTLESLRMCFTPDTIFADERGDFRIDCFEVKTESKNEDQGLVHQLGVTLRELYAAPYSSCSDELTDLLTLLIEERLRPDVLLYHPTVLANNDGTAEAYNGGALVARKFFESPLYVNVGRDVGPRSPSPPDVTALAIQLPGFVPRNNLSSDPQRVSQCTLSDQWMSRLVALRQREDALNRREKNLIAREVAESPVAKVAKPEVFYENRNGITLPPLVTRRSMRGIRRRKLRAAQRPTTYEDLDSSLSADAGDEAAVVTSARLPEIQPLRRSLSRRIAAKKVQIAASNPSVESDESVILTFYELEGGETATWPTQFKYLRPNETEAIAVPPQSPIKRKRLSDITNDPGLDVRPPASVLEVKKRKGRKSMLSFKAPLKFIGLKT